MNVEPLELAGDEPPTLFRVDQSTVEKYKDLRTRASAAAQAIRKAVDEQRAKGHKDATIKALDEPYEALESRESFPTSLLVSADQTTHLNDLAIEHSM